MLVSLRDAFTGEIDTGVSARDLVSLSRRLMEVFVETDELDAAHDDTSQPAETRA